jgi:hypothetical protein
MAAKKLEQHCAVVLRSHQDWEECAQNLTHKHHKLQETQTQHKHQKNCKPEIFSEEAQLERSASIEAVRKTWEVLSLEHRRLQAEAQCLVVEQVDRQSGNTKLLHQCITAPRIAAGGSSSRDCEVGDGMLLLLRQNVRALAQMQKQVQPSGKRAGGKAEVGKVQVTGKERCAPAPAVSSQYWAREADALHMQVIALQQQRCRTEDTARELAESIDKTVGASHAIQLSLEAESHKKGRKTDEGVSDEGCDGWIAGRSFHLVPPTPANTYAPTPPQAGTHKHVSIPLQQQRLNFDPGAPVGLL